MGSWPLQLVSVTLVLLLTASPLAAVVCDVVCAGAAAEVAASDASGAAPAHAHAGDTAAHPAHGTAVHHDHTVIVHPVTNADADAARIAPDPGLCPSHLAAPLPVTAARGMMTLLTPSTAAVDLTARDAVRPARLAQTHASAPPDVSFLRAPIVLRI